MNILDIIFASKLGKKGYLKLNNNTDRLLARHLYNKSSGQVEITTDTAPYVYRAVPVQNAYKEKMKKIVGASVVWNQLVQNGNFASLGNWKGGTNTNVSVANNTLSATPKDATASGNRFIYNNGDFFTLYSTHKYLIKSFATSTGSIKYQLIQNNPYAALGTVTVNCSTSKTLVYCITSPSSDTLTGRVNIVFDGRDYLNVEDLQIIDLTAMFGTTIADYVYTLETSQSGSGIAWLQSYGFFTEDYYAYKQNKLESGCVSAHKTYDGETLLTNTELSPITLRGLFKLSTDKLTVDGDEYNADGSVTRKYGIVEITNNTSLTGLQTSADYGAYANISDISAKVQGIDVVRLIADKCEVVSFNNRIASPTIDRAYIDNNGNLVIRANNSSSISSADALKSEFLGTTIIYELATPTTEQTTPFTETEIVGSTEEFIDYGVEQGTRDISIPVGHETDYYVKAQS